MLVKQCYSRMLFELHIEENQNKLQLLMYFLPKQNYNEI